MLTASSSVSTSQCCLRRKQCIAARVPVSEPHVIWHYSCLINEFKIPSCFWFWYSACYPHFDPEFSTCSIDSTVDNDWKFWKLICLSSPSKNITQFGPAKSKVPFSLGFFIPGLSHFQTIWIKICYCCIYKVSWHISLWMFLIFKCCAG